MHVVLDARYVSRSQSGVGHYTGRLVEGLAAIDRENRYTCLVHREAPGLAVEQANVVFRRTRVRFENHWVGDLWLLAYLPTWLRGVGADVYHGPAVFLPLVKAGYRTVVTIHDLVSFLFPETVPRKYAVYMRLMTRLAARSADYVIAVSHATQGDLVRLLGIRREKIVVIHEGVGAEFGVPVPAERVQAVTRRYGLRAPYCLFVGNLEPRKNLGRLVEAFALLAARRWPAGGRPQLVLAGTRGWIYEGIFRAVAKANLTDEIAFTGYVPAADLPALYAGATCFVFPSLYEGFGLPVLEAMAAGVPVVASRAGAIPEVAGDAALLIEATRPAEIAEAIGTVLADARLREEFAARGRARAARFRWDDTARRTLATYQVAYARAGGTRGG